MGHPGIRELDIFQGVGSGGDLTGIELPIVEVISLRFGFGGHRLARRSIWGL